MPSELFSRHSFPRFLSHHLSSSNTGCFLKHSMSVNVWKLHTFSSSYLECPLHLISLTNSHSSLKTLGDPVEVSSPWRRIFKFPMTGLVVSCSMIPTALLKKRSNFIAALIPCQYKEILFETPTKSFISFYKKWQAESSPFS